MGSTAMTVPNPPYTLWRKALNGVATILALIFIYVALLFSVVSVVDIVSPARVEEQSTLLFIAVVCAIVVITPPFLVPAFPATSANSSRLRA